MGTPKHQPRPRGSTPTTALERVVVPAVALFTLGAGVGAAAVARRGGRAGELPSSRDDGPGGRGGDRAPAKGLRGKLEALGARRPVLGRILDIQSRYGELHGNNLAAAITFQAFVSLLPLLLVIVAVVGFVAAGSTTDVADRIVSNLGLTGDASQAIRDAVSAAEDSRRAASVLGLAGLLWSGLGLINALQFGYNQVWQVQERGLKDKAVGIAWLGGAAVLFVAASAVTTVLRWLPGVVAPLGIFVGLSVNVLLWWWTAKLLPNRNVGWRPLLPGAILGGIGLEVLKVIGGIWVPRAVESSSQLYGSIGIVFAILAWLLFFGRLVLYSAVTNVVLWEHRAGTVKAVVEVPRQPGATTDVDRSGRMDRTDKYD